MNTLPAACIGTLNVAPRALAAVLLAVPLAAQAQAQASAAAPPPPADAHYVSVHAGINKLSSWPGQVDFGGPVSDASLGLERGANVGVALGKQRGHNRYELELQHGSFDIRHATLGPRSANVDESGSYDVLTINALREHSVKPGLAIYAGVGIGVARVDLPHVPITPNCACIAAADKTGFAWQVRAGAEHRVGQSGFVFGQLGYLKVPGPDAEGASPVSYRSRGFKVLSIGYRHLF